MSESESEHKYRMTISRLTVDKLGVKLYDRVSAVLAELVANSYDADATEVQIRAPMGQYLASRQGGIECDRGLEIEVSDNGIGMTPIEVNQFYLPVGAARRDDVRRGDNSKLYGRKVMGRKGVGKLAPFGICEQIEVLTSGGDLREEIGEGGQLIRGYETAHLILNRRDIVAETDEPYFPEVGEYDGTLRPKTGTTLRLTNFSYRMVPRIDTLERQLAQRFGISTTDWRITLFDDSVPENDPERTRHVGQLQIPLMENTKVTFAGGTSKSSAIGPDGEEISNLSAGFEYDGHFYPISGWIAYAAQPYRDELMAGVRIYCRGKIASQTYVFGRRAGFTGEHDVRSYLTGELTADWLDEEEDLILTDRRDILWSHDLGVQFQNWGQSVVGILGRMSRNPMRQTVWDEFRNRSSLDERVFNAFPAPEQSEIRENAIEIARDMGRAMRRDEIDDEEQVDSIVRISLAFAPHITLDEELRRAAEQQFSPLGVITSILRTARTAELVSYGRIADNRVRVISRLEHLKDDEKTVEGDLQDLIEEAPWLIDPQWSPITHNQGFSTLVSEFEKYFKKNTGRPIELSPFTETKKRPDFVLSNQRDRIELIEIKRPHHAFTNEEMERLNTYIEQMDAFLSDPLNSEFARSFSGGHYVTLVCDAERLTGVFKTAFNGLIQNQKLTHIPWRVFLLRTRQMHEDFLAEAERLQRLALMRAQGLNEDSEQAEPSP